MGTIKNSMGKAIAINGLWGLEFGGGSSLNGKTNQLFFTAGPSDTNGYFGVINFCEVKHRGPQTRPPEKAAFMLRVYANRLQQRILGTSSTAILAFLSLTPPRWTAD
jgi:hypothetical protein